VKGCGKRILAGFGLLLAAAILAVPYREADVVVTQEGRRATFATRTTTVNEGYMFLPRFLKRRGDWSSPLTRAERHTALRTGLYTAEIGVVIILGIGDYLIFCRWLRRRRGGRAGR
jgi:hypothetical protein